MIILPAIDLFGGKAVRLYKGDYAQMTVYSDDPLAVARDFKACGAQFIHMVDLEGARDGGTPNFDAVRRVAEETGLSVEIGGGVRSLEVIERYLSAGVERVILGTAAVTDEKFTAEAAQKYGPRLAVGIDVRDGFVAIKGWTEKTAISCHDFFGRMQSIGVGTVICTDISRDGAMAGTNRALYEELSKSFGVNIVASGGVSTLEDIAALRDMGLYGAIIGKAYYTGAIDLKKAIEVAG